MLMKVKVDFHAVEEHQRGIDKRLSNWARWCNGSASPACSPMFRLTPSPPRVRGDFIAHGVAVDRMDAAKIAKAVAALPGPHRAAVNWAYVKPVSPHRACVELGTTMQGLAMLLRDGRQMLINRGV